MTIQAKCIDKAFDSKNAIQYYPGDVVDIDLSNKDQRKLVWLKTLGGKWVFVFDRANSSSTALHMFFCKTCGQPFDKLNDLGNHSRSEAHSQDDIIVKRTKVEDADTEEERLLAKRRAAEEAEDSEQSPVGGPAGAKRTVVGSQA